MTKAELIEKMAKDARTTKAAAGRALNSFFMSVKKTLKEGKNFTIVGFGSFSVSQRKERKGRNPKTGAEIIIPERKVPKFTAARAFKDAIK